MIPRGHSEVGVASRTLPGQRECGDMAVTVSTSDQSTIGVVDGLGHGSQAALAARVAVETLEKHNGETLPELLRRCHDALRSTRGAAITVASLSSKDETVTWLGVGNIGGRLVRCRPESKAHETIMSAAGLAGHALPSLHPVTLPVQRGDLLVIATDGVRDGFAESLYPYGSAQDIADRILAEYHDERDDALVFVARYLGGSR